MAGTNYKSGLAIARAKQMIQGASKVQALQNFYNQFNQQQEEQEEGERMLVAKAQSEMDHKASLAVARSSNYAARASSSISEGIKTYTKVYEGPKWKAPFVAIEYALECRQRVKNHDNSPYLVFLIIAIISDIADPTLIIGLCFKLPLFIFLFGRGTWKVKLVGKALKSKTLLRRAIVMLIGDCIPIIGWLPISTIALLYAWRGSAKDAKEAKEELKIIEKELEQNEKENKISSHEADKIRNDLINDREYGYADDYEEAYAQAA